MKPGSRSFRVTFCDFMPLFYKHWSFGKQFAFQEASYRKGLMGLAYEIVINSSPCIS